MGHVETAHDMFILTQQQPRAEMCYKKRAQGSLPAQGPFSCRGNTVLLLGRFCAPLSESRVEQILCEDEVIDCACLDLGNKALKFPPTAVGIP